MIRYLRFLGIIFTFFLFACVPGKTVRTTTPGEERLAWHTYVTRSAQAEKEATNAWENTKTGKNPKAVENENISNENISNENFYGDRAFRISASLRYKDPQGEGARVSALFWGNNLTNSPLRLDLSAGIGTTVAKILENEKGFLAYNTDEKLAYFHPDKGSSLHNFGVPIPLSLKDLALILSGRSGQLFLPSNALPDAPAPVKTLSPKGVVYSVNNAPRPGLLEIASNGQLLSWQESSQEGWKMEFTPMEFTATDFRQGQNPLVPQSVKISHSQGYEAVITLREITYPQEKFKSSQLALSLPSGTETRDL